MVSLWHAFDSAIPVEVSRAAHPTASDKADGRARRAPAYPRVELLTPDDAQKHEACWRELGARALEPNLFFEPEFALRAATHLAQGQSPRFLFIWDDRDRPMSRLIAATPLLAPAFAFGEARLWLFEHMAHGTPLIDGERVDMAVGALLDVVRRGPARAAGLRLPRLDERGAFAEAVRLAAARSGRRVLRFEHPLEKPVPPTMSVARSGGKIVVARTPRQVREAVEHFLAIEAQGPRGRSGEALLLSPGISAFLRVVTRSLARTRRCRVELAMRGGKPVAADIILRRGDAEMLWKSARSDAAYPWAEGAVLDAAIGAGPTPPTSVDWLIAAKPGNSPATLALAARDRLGRRLRAIVRRAAPRAIRQR